MCVDTGDDEEVESENKGSIILLLLEIANFLILTALPKVWHRVVNKSLYFLVLKNQGLVDFILLDTKEGDEKDKDSEKSKEGGYGFAGLPKGAENLTPKERHVLR